MGKSSDSNTSDSDEDRRERDKFSERLKKKDKEKTRNIVSRSGNKLFTIRDSTVLYKIMLHKPSSLSFLELVFPQKYLVLFYIITI